MLLGLALAAFTAYVLAAMFAAAPAPESLERSTVTLAGPVQLSSGKSHGTCALLAWDGGRASIEHLCFLSGCTVPAALASLKAGDRVTLSLSAGNVWQVEHAGHVALHYDDMHGAYEAAMRRRCVVSIPLWAGAVALLAVALARRRKVAEDSRQGG